MYGEIDLFTQYLDSERNCSPNTLRSYTIDLRDFTSFLLEHSDNPESPYEVAVEIFEDDVQISSIDRNDITAFIESLYDKGLKRASIERKIATLRRFFKYLHFHEIIDINPAASISYPKSESRLPNFLYTADVEKILNFQPQTLLDYRDRALCMLLFSTGCRVSEVSTSLIVNLDFSSQRLKVMGKGSEERIVFLTDETAVSIKAYFTQRRKEVGSCEGALFINKNGNAISVRGIYNIVSLRAKNAGLQQHVSPHTFRHSFATELLNQGADIRAVQEMLGHKHLSTTQKYTHTTKERLRRTYLRTHPHANEE